MRLTIKILIGLLIGLFLGNNIWVVYDMRKDILINKDTTTKSFYINDQIIKYIFKELKNITDKKDAIYKDLVTKIDENYKDLTIQIEKIPETIQEEKLSIEYNLQQAVVIINNETLRALGSGVTIKYKNKFYILSAGHMTESKEDILSFSENDNRIGELEIIKWDFTTPEEDLAGDFTKGTDLLLLQPKNKDLIPKFYVELADVECKVPTEIYIVGNPAGIEDVLSDGRIVKYNNNFIYYFNHTYYGNSGGGIFTKDGKLQGIVSHMYPISLNPQIPPYMLYGAVRLNEIKEFLGDIE
jgi:hypothetical protein